MPKNKGALGCFASLIQISYKPEKILSFTVSTCLNLTNSYAALERLQINVLTHCKGK